MRRSICCYVALSCFIFCFSACDKKGNNSVLKQNTAGAGAAGAGAAGAAAAAAAGAAAGITNKIVPFSSSRWIFDSPGYYLWNSLHWCINKVTNVNGDDKEGKISKIITAGVLFFLSEFALESVSCMTAPRYRGKAVSISSKFFSAASLAFGNLIADGRDLSFWEKIRNISASGLGSVFSYLFDENKTIKLIDVITVMNRGVFILPMIAANMDVVSLENVAAFDTSFIGFSPVSSLGNFVGGKIDKGMNTTVGTVIGSIVGSVISASFGTLISSFTPNLLKHAFNPDKAWLGLE